MEFDHRRELRWEEWANTPIPKLVPVAGWKEVPIEFSREPLVALGPYSNYGRITTDSIYAGEKIDSPYGLGQLKGFLLTQFVRQAVAEKLVQAQEILPRGKRLVVFDAYRTLEVQQALYEKFVADLKKIHPDWSEGTVSVEAQRFVSVPSKNSAAPSPHNTGGAVDLAIFNLPLGTYRRLGEIETRLASHGGKWQSEYVLEMERMQLISDQGKLLSYGTSFDYGREEAGLAYFENSSDPLEREFINNRRRLYWLMREVGMEAYPDEWWHFNDPKTQMGAKSSGQEVAEYGGIQLSMKNQEHELMRRGHFVGNLRLQKNLAGRGFWKNPYSEAVLAGVAANGDIRGSGFPMAEEISPT